MYVTYPKFLLVGKFPEYCLMTLVLSYDVENQCHYVISKQ